MGSAGTDNVDLTAGDDGGGAPRASNQPMASSYRVAVARLLSVAWIANAVLLLAAFGWVFLDGRSVLALERFQRGLAKLGSQPPSRMFDVFWNFPSLAIVAGGAVAALATVVLMFAGLMVGDRKFRSMRTWLAFTAVVAGWLTFIVSWPDVYWRGQQRRVAPMLVAAEKLARQLEENWPTEDGYTPEVGPFLAYPQGAPTTVLPLQKATFPGTDQRFTSIERSTDGSIRFELAGGEVGAWLERRGDESEPTEFVSGLKTRYRIERETQIAPQWFLVRYGFNMSRD